MEPNCPPGDCAIAAVGFQGITTVAGTVIRHITVDSLLQKCVGVPRAPRRGDTSIYATPKGQKVDGATPFPLGTEVAII